MNEEIIPIKEEPVEKEESQTASTPEIEDSFNRSLIPPDIATVGRSVKLRDLFSTSGAVASDATVVTVTANGSGGAETDMKTFQFFKHEWHEGMCIRVTAYGVVTQDASLTCVLAMGSGSAPTSGWGTVQTSPAGVLTDAAWKFILTGTVRSIGPSGQMEVSTMGVVNNVLKETQVITPITIDTTSDIVLALTANWTGSAAGNSISIRQWMVEILY